MSPCLRYTLCVSVRENRSRLPSRVPKALSLWNYKTNLLQHGLSLEGSYFGAPLTPTLHLCSPTKAALEMGTTPARVSSPSRWKKEESLECNS